MKEQKTDKLTKTVQNRRQVQEKLSAVMKCIKTAEEGVEQLQDQNNLCLAEMLSILEQDTKIASQQGGQNFFLSELMKMVDDSSPDDTVETLRLKMDKTVQSCGEKLKESKALVSQYDFQETMYVCRFICIAH